MQSSKCDERIESFASPPYFITLLNFKCGGGGGPKRGIFRGGEGWPFEFSSRGLRLRVMSKLSVILLLIGLSEQNYCSHR